MTDWATFIVTLAGAMLAAGALCIAIVVAIRDRTISKPRVDFRFRYDPQFYPTLPGHRRGWRPAAIFLIPNEQKTDIGFHVPFSVENVSMRQLNEVHIELTYPSQFTIFNFEHAEQMATLPEYFGRKGKADQEDGMKIIEKRIVQEIYGLSRVIYNLGTMNPGHANHLAEVIRLPERDESFNDPRYNNTAFSNCLSSLKKSPSARAAFRVTASVYSNLTQRADYNIDVIISASSTETAIDEIEKSYVDALWFGEYPAGKWYFRPPRLPFSRILPLARETAIDVIKVGVETIVSEMKDGKVLVGFRGDPFNSEYGVGTLYFPGYTPDKLPKNVNNPDLALKYIGYIRNKPEHLPIFFDAMLRRLLGRRRVRRSNGEEHSEV